MFSALFFALAALCVILIPFAPQLVRLRISIMRWLNWNWAVNLLESNFDGWVTFFRIVLAVLAVMFLAIGFEGPD